MVATVTVTTFQIVPGKSEEVKEAIAGYRSMIEAQGGKVRTWVTIYAGENSNRLVVTAEYESAEAVGRALDHIMSGDVPANPFNVMQQKGAAEFIGRSVMTEWNPA